MRYYKYKARFRGEKPHKSLIQAPNESVAHTVLKDMGMHDISISRSFELEISQNVIPYVICGIIVLFSSFWLFSFWDIQSKKRAALIRLASEGSPVDAVVTVRSKTATKSGKIAVSYFYEFADATGAIQKGIIFPYGTTHSVPNSFGIKEVDFQPHEGQKIVAYMLPSDPTIHAPFKVEDKHIRMISFSLALGTFIAVFVFAFIAFWLRGWRRQQRLPRIIRD